jgi:hypothetical protein
MTTKKILCIGNNTTDTDSKTSQLAKQNNSKSFGLLTELNGHIIQSEFDPGYYHSSVYDIQYSQLLELAKQFDSIIILDQPAEQYSHPDAFYQTIRLANELSATHDVIFKDPNHPVAIKFFEQLVHTNKSFCIFPFIELLAFNGNTNVCCRSKKTVTKLANLENFQTDPHYVAIRNKMIAGELLPDHCSSCYQLEDQGILSARIQETVEWSNRLGLTSLDDLSKIESPVYYEVRPSNICNLQCRMCSPDLSHLIAREYKKIKIIKKDYSELEYTNFDFIEFTNLKKLLVSGGEPMAMIEFYDFLDRCIDNNQTDFELLINTNGTKLSDRVKAQLKKFSTVSFIVSIDGYQEINHYIRWPSDWNNIVSNTEYLCKNHAVTFNITVSIYNILTLSDLISFLSQTFPGAGIHCQFVATRDDRLSALNFPYPELVAEKLPTIQELACYKNDKLLKSFIDALIDHYSQQPNLDLDKLRLFFKFNDRLDRSRNIKLADYILPLENARQLI